MEEKKLAVRNATSSLVAQLIKVWFQFVLRKLFIQYIGIELLGINQTLASLIAAVALIEGGIQSAVIYHLYGKIANNDENGINDVLNVYRFLYTGIGVVVLVIGIVTSCFVDRIVTGIEVTGIIYVYYFLIVINTAASYFLAYKRALFTADRRDYVCRYCDTLCDVIFSIFRIITIVWYRNFLLYLFLAILQTIVSNIVINIVCNKKYPFIKREKHKKELLDKMSPDIKNLFGGSIAAYIFNSVDNIIISKFVSTIAVGLFSNYTMVTTTLKMFIFQVCSFWGPIMGNRFSVKPGNKEIKKEYLQIYSFANYFLACMIIVPEFLLLQDFVSIFLGKERLLPNLLIIIVLIEQYITLVQDPCGVFIVADGQFRLSKIADGTAAVLNLVASLVFVQFWGIYGVILGTIISRIVQWLIKSTVAFHVTIGDDGWGIAKYWMSNFYKACVLFIITSIAYEISLQMSFESFILEFICLGIMGVFVAFLGIVLMFWFTEDGGLILKIVKNSIHKT
ncbi:MAG: oligosaccharide flippase family protein [Phascolarctobacterium sp.]|uniref:lipopolysaccharide biosynthesis protein n=1 Tax=Phascolarctobacterium sp. TaxID=2049039 RepID=UPI0025DE8B86|nr:oligosaccharide flippase family protein [Phascolarctobacterium sp.]MCC8158713.1 oligosaccharide flippase family protein [Phascolarctobacterium sp.]